MAFLIVSNGQFSPLTIPLSNQQKAIHPVVPIEISSEIQEFDEVLQEKLEVPSKKISAGIKQYQRFEKKYEQEKKRFYARDIMSSPVKMISQRAPALEARELLHKFSFRHLPVINDHSIITGMISDKEVVGDIQGKDCADIMVPKIVVAEEFASIHEIAIILLKQKINALPIVNHKRIVSGIVTQSDILKHVVDTTTFLGRA